MIETDNIYSYFKDADGLFEPAVIQVSPGFLMLL